MNSQELCKMRNRTYYKTQIFDVVRKLVMSDIDCTAVYKTDNISQFMFANFDKKFLLERFSHF